MVTKIQERQVGDRRTAIAAQLKRPDGSVVDLTGLTVKFAMYDISGNTVVSETANNVDVTDAENGKVQYNPRSVDVAAAGMYYAYFVVEDGSGLQDTFPAKKGEFRIVVYDVA